MTESTHRLEVTTPADDSIVMTRLFGAPRTLVFEAFTQPELIRRWLLGPDGWSMPVCEVDLKPGGAYHYVWRSDDDESKQFGVSGVYREIVPGERTVHLEKFDDAWYPGEAEVTTTFVEESGTTTVTMTIRYESREIRDMALESGMERGVAISYDRLAAILAA